MRSQIEFPEEFLQNDIGGIRRYCFDAPIHLDYVNSRLCKMTGRGRGTLLSVNRDTYAQCVHPEDRAKYGAFLRALSEGERRLTVNYRLLRPNGTVLHVLDTASSMVGEDGRLHGYAIVTDATDFQHENDALERLNDTVPCGIVTFTCEEIPKVTYLNDQMKRILGLDSAADGGVDHLAQYRENVYMFVPPEERGRFRSILERVHAQEDPVTGDLTMVRSDGKRIFLYGWISQGIGAGGQPEYQSVCIDATERFELVRQRETRRYLSALSQAYDEILEFDFLSQTVRFLSGSTKEQMGQMAHAPMAMREATAFWIDRAVHPDDRAAVRAYFETILQEKSTTSEMTPVQFTFRALESDRAVQNCLGIFLDISRTGCLFCRRNIPERQMMRDSASVMGFADGMLAFEIRGEKARPLYMSDNVCRFLGYSREEWLSTMQVMTPIPEFVSRCRFSYDDFQDLLENGEAEYHYTDVATSQVRRLRALRSSRADDGSCFVMLFDITGQEITPPMPRVAIRTFGYFDVFVDDQPIAFRHEKAKELLALLVDRRGGFVSSGEAVSILWEDEPATPVTLARYRKVALRLKNILEENGIGSILESVDGKRRIVPQLVSCDLYDYLSGDNSLFKGSYLQNYSWGETTLAELNESRKQ